MCPGVRSNVSSAWDLVGWACDCGISLSYLLVYSLRVANIISILINQIEKRNISPENDFNITLNQSCSFCSRTQNINRKTITFFNLEY